MLNKIQNILNNQNMAKYAPTITRIGLSLVFLWFGGSQVLNPEPWTQLIPALVTDISHISALNFVYINGTFEIIFGLMMLLGIYTRISALLLGLHLLTITIDVGYNSVGVRDFGLSLATLSIFFANPDFLTIDARGKESYKQDFIKNS